MTIWTAILAGVMSAQAQPNISPMADVLLSAEIRNGGPVWFAWSITPAGDLTYTERQVPTDAIFEMPVDYWLVTYRINVGVAGYHRIQAMMAPALLVSPDDWKCEAPAPDTPYGWVKWGEGSTAVTHGYYVCRSIGFSTLSEGMASAKDQLSTWAHESKVASRIWMGSSPEPSIARVPPK